MINRFSPMTELGIQKMIRTSYWYFQIYIMWDTHSRLQSLKHSHLHSLLLNTSYNSFHHFLCKKICTLRSETSPPTKMSKKDIKSVKTVFADVEALTAIMQSCINLMKKVGNKLSIPTELRPAPAEFGRPSGGGCVVQ